MIAESRTTTHPGEILREEFLVPLALSADSLAEHLGVSRASVRDVVEGRMPVTAELAWGLAQALGTSPEFWLNLQTRYDLTLTRPAEPIAPIAR